MKPPLHQMPSGDWVPVEGVKSIVVNPARTDEISTQKAHVVIYFDDKTKFYCIADSFESAKQIAAKLGEAVNKFRATYEYADLTNKN